MALKAYEDACTRAELFGQPLPDKERFLEENKHLDVVEFEEVEMTTAAAKTAMLDDHLKEASGGLRELNTLLASTQTKLNKFKGVCGSFTNFFRGKLTAKDNLSYSSDPSYVGQTNYDKDCIPPKQSSVNEGLGPNDNEMTPRAGNSRENQTQNCADINTALGDLKTMQKNDKTPIVKDIGNQITSQVSKLDQMIDQADRASASLQHQNKQIRSFAK